MTFYQSKAQLFPSLHLLDDFNQFQLQGGFIKTLAEKDLRLQAPASVKIDELSHIPCVSIYDAPAHTTAADLQRHFCSKSQDDEFISHQIFKSLIPVSHLSPSGHQRHYQLVAFLEEQQQTPIAFVTFNVGLLDSWYADGNTCDDRHVGVCCYLLYAYVVPEMRHLGISSCLFHLISNLFWSQLQYVDAQAQPHNLTMVPLVYESTTAKGAEGLMQQLERNINQYKALLVNNDNASGLIKPCMSNLG
ncbi:hypothetical protein [Shewanella pneumatophori]|uniref:N-acetyltransferase domain-containing protein n=1 Tax=Shewanella pneumatophori TaxID=314092 RepID=A0A9X1ZDB3_9GAMM|nr:hypothetical protein [Shewanella pneumatophori]MCL1137707.1 hypothetical protein [Shewanella pneumatophori]